MTVRVSALPLQIALAQTLPRVARPGSGRGTLEGVRLRGERDGLSVTGTDSYALTKITIEGVTIEGEAVLTAASAKAALPILKAATVQVVTVEIDGATGRLVTPAGSLVLAFCEGQYPRCDDVIPPMRDASPDSSRAAMNGALLGSVLTLAGKYGGTVRITPATSPQGPWRLDWQGSGWHGEAAVMPMFTDW